MKFSVIGAFFTAAFGSVAGRVQDGLVYPLKHRQDQATTTQRFHLTDLPYYEISYSDDSSPKLLSRFIIALFETDGELPFYPSLFNVEMALQDYVEAELNFAYAPFSRIKEVHAKVVSQTNTASTRNMRSLQMRGSELEMELNVTFANEPSPDIPDVDVALKTAMENMTYFLTNLTKRAEGDKELENVHSAFRLEISGANPIQEPTDKTSGGEPEAQATNNKFIIPIVCAACAVTLFAGFLAIRRQRGSGNRTVRAHGNEYGMHWGDESDIFSFETALLQTPHEKALPVKTRFDGDDGTSSDFRYGDEDIDGTRARCVSSDETSYKFTEIALDSPNRGSVMRSSSEYNRNYEMSDMFGVANSESTSQGDSPVSKKATRSLFSVFSSRASAPSKAECPQDTEGGSSDLQMMANAALVVDLGHTEQIITPNSNTSSVFTFSDDEEGQRGRDSHDEVMEMVDDIEAEYRPNWPVHGNSGVETEHLPKKEDLSLSGELLGLSVAGVQSGDDLPSPKSVDSEQFDEETPRNGRAQYYAESQSTYHDLSSQEHVDHSLPPSKSSPVYLQRKSMSDSKIKREKETITLHPKSHSDSKLKSRNGPHEHSQGGANGVEKNSSGFYDWGITLRPVKSPMRSRKESSELNGEEAHYNQTYLRDTPKDDRDYKSFDALWESEEANSVHKMGRRHTKSTVADGSTNYQSEAMDPTDWSVSTGEEASYASTEVADTTPQKSGKKKRNFLSGLFASAKKKGPDRVETGKASNPVEQSPASTATDEQHAEAEAASHKEHLISDLVWLESKHAPSKGPNVSSLGSEIDSSESCDRSRQLGDENRQPLDSSRGESFLEDSLSFRSGDQSRSYYGSSLDTTSDLLSPGAEKESASKGMQTILCRDCFAPPGKLKIVIHSTKDGPAIHTVKPDSALTGHLFPGDLIISVDDVDTRSFTAEQVMKMMTERARSERKITVLHFDKTEEL